MEGTLAGPPQNAEKEVRQEEAWKPREQGFKKEQVAQS